MKKKYLLIFIILVVLAVMSFGIYFYKSYINDKYSKEESVNAERLSTEISINEQTAQNEENYRKEHPTETEISSYSSPLKDKSAGRLNNIQITCSKLNGVIVNSGETFSFCDTVGEITSAKGYQKASVIENGKSVQALGGGNCQVSSTLYNAVLAVNNLEIVERHEHGKNVTYVPDGKDAAVSHGSWDFRFKNSTPDNIKIYLSSDDVNVYSSLVKLSY